VGVFLRVCIHTHTSTHPYTQEDEARTKKQEEDRQNRIGKQDKQNEIGRTEHPEQDRQDGKSRTGHAE
jgi:hypothetical protein